MDEWLIAEDHPTKGFAHRPGWHCTANPNAPHLSDNPVHENRVWLQVEIIDYVEQERPLSQGGMWYLAKQMRIIDQEIPV